MAPPVSLSSPAEAQGQPDSEHLCAPDLDPSQLSSDSYITEETENRLEEHGEATPSNLPLLPDLKVHDSCSARAGGAGLQAALGET